VRVRDRGVRIADVAAERGLAVGPGGDQPGPLGSVADGDREPAVLAVNDCGRVTLITM
jgi:hypothetical protein